VPVELTETDRAILSGRDGDAAALAMRVVVEMAGVMGASSLIDVVGAHVDSCLYHGLAGLDFAERLVAGGGRVTVPTTLNVGSLDLLHPERTRLDPEVAARGRRQMDAYVAMGCRPTWTCAPYQLPERPRLGDLGARTNRYGDFIDVCAAITGRVPFAGLHRDDDRRARLVLRLDDVPPSLLESDAPFPALGHVLGRRAWGDVAAIVGLPATTTEDRLKALGAAAASSGAVGMFHAVGITPEAPTLEACAAGSNLPEVAVTTRMLRAARDELGGGRPGSPIGAVSVGTPHASLDQLTRLRDLLDGRRPRVPLWVNTGREVLAEAERKGVNADLERGGVRIVADTCTYLAPLMDDVDGPVMTDSGKWAWYAPANIGVEVVIGGLEECVRSALEGRLVRDDTLWGDD
jgi:predicted aconitase